MNQLYNLISEEACFKKWSKAKIKELKPKQPLNPGNGYCAIGQWFFTHFESNGIFRWVILHLLNKDI